MNPKFKIGDRVVIVGSWKRSDQDLATVVEDTLNWTDSHTPILIKADVPFASFSQPDGVREYSACTDEDSLEFEHIYNSPLYKALL